MNKKIAPEVWRIVSILFKIFVKVRSKRILPGIFRFGSMLFLSFEEAMNQKPFRGIFRFVSMVLLVFENVLSQKLPHVFSDSEVCSFNNWISDEQNTCSRIFKNRKYAFFNICKSKELKNCARYF